MSIAGRVTYLKGLAEGLNLGNDTKEEKILRVIIEVLVDLSTEVEELKGDVQTLDEDLGALVEDLEELVEEVEDLGKDVDELGEDVEGLEASHGEACCCATAPPSAPVSAPVTPVVSGRTSGRAGGRQAKNKPQFFEVECPSCENEITIDEDVLGLGIIDCPNCGERLELDVED
jgi:ribosomal protein S27E/FtsZ-binding cell division protein ZapB